MKSKPVLLVAVGAMVFLVGCPCPCSTKYFLVSDPSGVHRDSFILPLTDPDDIAHARALIADPEGTSAKIILANIAEDGSSGAYRNRDLLQFGREWSWRVSEFQGFAEATIEIYDGTPTYVEDHLDDWFASTGGVIGFWSYTVTMELPWFIGSGLLKTESPAQAPI